MTPFRSEGTVRIISETQVAIVSSLKSRITFLVTSCLLAVTMAVGIDPTYDFSPERLPGTIIASVLLLITLGAGLYQDTILFDLKMDSVTRKRGLVGGVFVRQVMLAKTSQIRRLIIGDLVLMQTGKRKSEPVNMTGFGGYLERRSHIYHLSLELAPEAGERRITVQEGSYRDEIEVSASVLSHLLGTEIRQDTYR